MLAKCLHSCIVLRPWLTTSLLRHCLRKPWCRQRFWPTLTLIIGIRFLPYLHLTTSRCGCSRPLGPFSCAILDNPCYIYIYIHCIYIYVQLGLGLRSTYGFGKPPLWTLGFWVGMKGFWRSRQVLPATKPPWIPAGGPCGRAPTVPSKMLPLGLSNQFRFPTSYMLGRRLCVYVRTRHKHFMDICNIFSLVLYVLGFVV